MAITNSIQTILKLKPEESRPVALLFLHSFFIGIAQVYLSTAANTLFLSEFDANMLPYAYIGAAIFTTLVGFIYAKLEEYLSFTRLLSVNLLSMFLSLGLFRFFLLWDSKWVVMAFNIWCAVVVVLVNIEFWGLAGRLFNIRQGKRLFGLIGSGEVIASILGGFSVSWLVEWSGAANLILVSAFGIGLSLIILIYITRLYAKELVSPEEETFEKTRDGDANRNPLSNLFKQPYIVLIFSLSALTCFGFYFVDNMFFNRIAARYTNETELAAVLGNFEAAVSIGTLIMRLLISDRLMNRYGLKVGLLAMPVAIGAAALVVAFTGSAFGLIPVIFWLTTGTKYLYGIHEGSINQSALLILFQPLQASQRLQAQMFTDSAVEPIAGGVAGLVLLLLTNILSFGPVQLSYCIVVITIGWIFVAFFLQKNFSGALMKALEKRSIERGTNLSLDNESGTTILHKALQSSCPEEVIYALDIMEENEHRSLQTILLSLLDHPEPAILIDVMSRIERLDITGAVEPISRIIEKNSFPHVRGAGLRVLAAVGGADVLDVIEPYLSADDIEIRIGAAVGMLRSGGIQGVLIAGADLLKRVGSEEAADRIFAARVIGAVGIRDFYQPLVGLLEDENFSVRREALASAGQLINPKLWPQAVENLRLPEVRSTAIAALVAGGTSSLAALEAAFNMEGRKGGEKSRLIRIYGQIKGERVLEILQENLDATDNEVFYQVLVSLSLCGFHAGSGSKEEALIIERLNEQIENSLWLLAAMRDLDAHESLLIVTTALIKVLEQNINRIFLLLSFVYDSKVVLRAFDNLTHPVAEKRAYAIEIIDNILPQHLKTILIPLIENASSGQSPDKTESSQDHDLTANLPKIEEIYRKATEWEDPWLSACAIHAIAGIPTVQSAVTIREALQSPNVLVRESAMWALYTIDKEAFMELLPDLCMDPDPHIVWTAFSLEGGNTDEGGLMPLIEIALLLGKVSIFLRSSGHVLATVAQVLKNVHIKAGGIIIKEGDVGDCMYIIASGKVHLYNTQRDITDLGNNQIFGEFSILDSEQRTASAKAVEDTYLFRLDQAAFYELMTEQHEVAQGMIMMLCRRIRERQALISTAVDEKEGLPGSGEEAGEENPLNPAELLPVEKILILKAVGYFSQLSKDILPEVVAVLKTVKIRANTRIIEKEEIANCMYIIISGRVKIHDGDQTFSFLGERGVFGELAVLDAEPRSTSVTAVADTWLFRLDGAIFHGLMVDRFEITREVIRSLCRRFRALVAAST